MPINNHGPYPGNPYLGNMAERMQVASSRLFYSAYDSLTGVELWSSDGTTGGTGLVRDINLQKNGSDSTYLTAVGNRIFFIAADNTAHYRIWTSDGTEIGTRIIEELGTVGILRAEAASNGIYLVLDSKQLWWIDGVTLTPTLLRESQSGTFTSLVVDDHQLFFFLSSEDEQERGLWRSDSTLAGTQRIKALQASYVLTSVMGTLFFQIDDGIHGEELWKSDGTEAGTVLLKDINPGAASAFPYPITDVNGTLFFQADDSTHGRELWKSDGTAEGTVLVKDSFPGPASSNLEQLTVVQDRLFFINSESTLSNYELWVSDGTEVGTHLVKDIHPNGGTIGPLIPSPTWLTAFNDKLLFVANDSIHGEELWISDGTEAGTVLVRDINPGIAGSSPDALTNVNGIVLFASTDGSGQRTLWRSDGTASGTQSIQAITPKPDLYNYRPPAFVQAGDDIFFSADDGTNGRQLWKIPLTANGLLLDTPALVGAPAGGIGRIPVEFGNQGSAQQTNATLTVTLDERLTYLDSTGSITPTITANTLVWSLPDLGVLSAGELDLRVQIPAAPLGTRYPVTITLAAGPAGSSAPSETSRTIEVMAADQNYLPVVSR